jgi:hypothetical protein
MLDSAWVALGMEDLLFLLRIRIVFGAVLDLRTGVAVLTAGAFLVARLGGIRMLYYRCTYFLFWRSDK